MTTPREMRRERLEQAAERMAELEQALKETQQALATQSRENANLTRRVPELQAVNGGKQAVRAVGRARATRAAVGRMSQRGDVLLIAALAQLGQRLGTSRSYATFY